MPLVGSNAPICVEPLRIALATPLEPGVFEIVAILSSVDDHKTEPVRSLCDESENVPTTVNVWVDPTTTSTSAGAMVIEVNVAGVTVNQADPVIVPVESVAVMSALPSAFADASP